LQVKIKICGITQYEDARIAANLGVDALGFIFCPRSPRCIQPSGARDIIRRLPPFISRVGVFVDADEETILSTIRVSGIDTLQLHGAETPQFCNRMPLPVIKSFSVHADFDLQALEQYPTAGHLLDTWDDKSKGGTGRRFDWSVAVRAAQKFHAVILAGGLGPANILEAMERVRPFAVDVNSGVEIKPGIKNPQKMHDVVDLVRRFS